MIRIDPNHHDFESGGNAQHCGFPGLRFSGHPGAKARSFGSEADTSGSAGRTAALQLLNACSPKSDGCWPIMRLDAPVEAARPLPCLILPHRLLR